MCSWCRGFVTAFLIVFFTTPSFAQPSLEVAEKLLDEMSDPTLPGLLLVRSEHPADNRVKNPLVDISRWKDTVKTTIPLVLNDTTLHILQWLLEDERKAVANALAVARYYEPLIEFDLSQSGLPLELQVYPLVVSSANPVASYEGGAGYWKLFFPWAVRGGLVVHAQVDERLDPYKSTDATAQLIRQLRKNNTAWHEIMTTLACGPSYNEIEAGPFREWCMAIPEYFTAWLYIYQNQHLLGLAGRNVIPVPLDTIIPSRRIPFKIIAEQTGIDSRNLIRHNPTLIKHETVAAYSLWIESKHIAAYREKEDVLQSDSILKPPPPAPPKAEYYRVRSGDTLSEIAAKFGVSVSALRDWNNLRSTMIYAGQELIIRLDQ